MSCVNRSETKAIVLLFLDTFIPFVSTFLFTFKAILCVPYFLIAKESPYCFVSDCKKEVKTFVLISP